MEKRGVWGRTFEEKTRKEGSREDRRKEEQR